MLHHSTSMFVLATLDGINMLQSERRHNRPTARKRTVRPGHHFGFGQYCESKRQSHTKSLAPDLHTGQHRQLGLQVDTVKQPWPLEWPRGIVWALERGRVVR